MSNIRVTYSGLLALVSGLGSIFTGLMFSLIVTRTLTAEEFGTWSLILSILGYLVVSESLVNYWASRNIARGDEDVGKTSFITSIIFGFGLIPIYITLSILFSTNSNAISSAMFLGLILVPLYLLSRTLTAINSAFQPHKTSYGIMILELTRVPSAFLFVYIFDLGINGAIYAIFIAYLIKVIFQTFIARKKLQGRFNLTYIVNWVKLSWISLYSAFPNFFKTFDIALYALISSSVIGLAFYTVPLTICNLVSHTGKISQGLYAKLLSGGDYSYITENLSLSFYFGLPLVGLSIIFSKPALHALNPIYIDASQIVVLLSIQTFFFSQNSLINKAMLGIEKIDSQKNIAFKNYLKSNLFMLPTYRYIKLGVYLTSLSIILIFNKDHSSELDLVFMWSLLAACIEIPYFIFLWIKLKNITKINFPYSDIFKYFFATISFMFIFWVFLEQTIIYHERIFDFLPQLLIPLTICLIVYFGITYLIDKKTRRLFSLIIDSISKRK